MTEINNKCLCNNPPVLPPPLLSLPVLPPPLLPPPLFPTPNIPPPNVPPPNIPPPNIPPPNIPPPNIPIMLITLTSDINNSISNRKYETFNSINNTLDNIQINYSDSILSNSSSVNESSNNNLLTSILIFVLIIGCLLLFVFNKCLLNTIENILLKKNKIFKSKICPT